MKMSLKALGVLGATLFVISRANPNPLVGDEPNPFEVRYSTTLEPNTDLVVTDPFQDSQCGSCLLEPSHPYPFCWDVGNNKVADDSTQCSSDFPSSPVSPKLCQGCTATWACAPKDTSEPSVFSSCKVENEDKFFPFETTPCTPGVESELNRAVECIATDNTTPVIVNTTYCSPDPAPAASISNKCKYEHMCPSTPTEGPTVVYTPCNYCPTPCSTVPVIPTDAVCVQPTEDPSQPWSPVPAAEQHYCAKQEPICEDKCQIGWFCGNDDAADADFSSFKECNANDTTTGYIFPEDYATGCLDLTIPPKREVSCLRFELAAETGKVTVHGEVEDDLCTAALKPQEELPESSLCVYDWRCAATGAAEDDAYSDCAEAAFTCAATTEVATKCFAGVYTRTVACVNQDNRVAPEESKCSAAAPARENGNCVITEECSGKWVCTENPDVAITSIVECNKEDVITGVPSCVSPSPAPGPTPDADADPNPALTLTSASASGSLAVSSQVSFTRSVRCFAAGAEDAAPVPSEDCLPEAKPQEVMSVDECTDWTKVEGACTWNATTATSCFVGTRTDTYECKEGEGKCDSATKPADELDVPCTFSASQCSFAYICAPAGTDDVAIADMTPEELLCTGTASFVTPDTRMCFKNAEFTRRVACYDTVAKTISNTAEECLDLEVPAATITLTNEEQCTYAARCVALPMADDKTPTDADFAAAPLCMKDGKDDEETFGTCQVECKEAWRRRAAKCVSEVGTVVDDDKCNKSDDNIDGGTDDNNNVKTDIDDTVTKLTCVTAPALTLRMSEEDPLAVGEEAKLKWCYYHGTSTAATQATVTLSSVAAAFPTQTLLDVDVVAEDSAAVVVPAVLPVTDAVITLAVSDDLFSATAPRVLLSRCDVNADYCGEHGTCVRDTSSCECRNDRIGERCNVDACEVAKCKDAYTDHCVAADGTAACTCKAGFYGAYCERADMCRKRTDKCLHDGYVELEDDDNECEDECTCPKPWRGDYCERCGLSCSRRQQANADCSACVCVRGYAGSNCKCRQAYGALTLINAPVDVIASEDWRKAFGKDVAAFAELAEDMVEVLPGNKGKIAIGLTHCGKDADKLSMKSDVDVTMAMLLSRYRAQPVARGLVPVSAATAGVAGDDDDDDDENSDGALTELYTKWARINADINNKDGTSVLKQGEAMKAVLVAGAAVTAAAEMYDPTCTGAGCSKGEDPFQDKSGGSDNTATIVIAVFASLAVVLIIAAVVYYMKKRRSGKAQMRSTAIEMDEPDEYSYAA